MTATAVHGRQLLTEVPGPRSQELLVRRKAAVSAGVGGLLPVFVERAEPGILVDVDGNRFVDLGSGIAVTSVGANAPRVVDAVRDQVAAFTHTCFMITPYEGYVRVCEELARLTPGSHDKRSVLLNSGAEAVENAVKVARAATGRTAVAVFDHGYHGRTNLTMALTAKASPYKKSFGPFAPEVYRLPMSYPFREPAPMTGAEAADRALRSLETQVAPSDLACMVVEPVQGEGGFVVPAPGFLPRLAQWCRDNGVVFVADEVQTGFGRTGDWFACDDEGVVPDLIVTAKALADGLPLGAVTGRAELMDAVHGSGLGGTYGGNPVACAAALAVVDTIERDGLVERSRALGVVLREGLTALADRHPEIGDVRGRGTMQAVEIVRPGTVEPDGALTQAVAKVCHARGVVVLTAGTYGNVLRLLPPFVIPDEVLADGLDVLEEAFAEVLRTSSRV